MRQFYIVFLENTSHHPFGPPDHPSIHPSLTFFFFLEYWIVAVAHIEAHGHAHRQAASIASQRLHRWLPACRRRRCRFYAVLVFRQFLRHSSNHTFYTLNIDTKIGKQQQKKNSKANRKKKFAKKNLFDILTEKHNFENVHGARVCECESRSACVFVFAQGKRVEQCSIVVM